MMTRPPGLERFENILVFDRVPSTQDLARQLVSTLDDDEISLPCTVVAARRQTKGRGRGDRGWFSPAGGLYLTLVLPVESLEAALHRPLAAAVLLAETLRETFGVDAAIKWPNDVLCGGRKVAGLLLEHVARKSGAGSLLLVGLGLNLERAALVDGGDATGAAVALDELTGRPVGFDEALTAVLRAFAREESAPRSREAILARWRELAIHRPGDELRVRLGDGRESTGRFAGLDEVGRLELETAAGVERIASADLVP